MASIGFLYPGQGSQFAGMGKDFTEARGWAADLYRRAASTLGFDLADVSFNGPEETLRQTRFTQPALLAHSAIADRLLRERGVVPDAVAGHSLGEYSALVSAGVFSFDEGLALVGERSRLMSEAGSRRPGAMAAVIGLDPGRVEDACRAASAAGTVQPANFNSPEQTVISGSIEGVRAACEAARSAGAKRVMELPVSGAFHSPLMEETAAEFAKRLEAVSFSAPAVPVYTNVTASAVREPDRLRDALTRQMTHPVRWVETIQAMIADGVTTFYEVGPGRVLAGLVKRIDRSAEVIACGTLAEIEAVGA
jgi:[acyl-carrier-protein] S-malonyltransferase